MSLVVNVFQRKLIPVFVVFALAAVPLCGVIAADYSSAGKADVEAKINYSISRSGYDHAVVLECLNKWKATTATIQPTYYGFPVTEIGDYAFRGCSLTSVTLPDSVTEIGEWAFGACRYLASINIPDSVTEIGKRAFVGCTSLTSINIPDSVTKIGKAALNCSNLEKIITTLDIHPGDYGSPSTVSIVHPSKEGK